MRITRLEDRGSFRIDEIRNVKAYSPLRRNFARMPLEINQHTSTRKLVATIPVILT